MTPQASQEGDYWGRMAYLAPILSDSSMATRNSWPISIPKSLKYLLYTVPAQAVRTAHEQDQVISIGHRHLAEGNGSRGMRQTSLGEKKCTVKGTVFKIICALRHAECNLPP